MAEFTVIADKYHVHVTDGHRTEEYDIEAMTEAEALVEAKRRWSIRSAKVAPSVADLPPAPEVAAPEPGPIKVDPAPSEPTEPVPQPTPDPAMEGGGISAA